MATVKSIEFNNKNPEHALKIAMAYANQKQVEVDVAKATSKVFKKLEAFKLNMNNVVYEFTPEYASVSSMVNGSYKEIASVSAGRFFPLESKNILVIAVNYELYLLKKITSSEFKQNLMRECTYEERDYKMLAKTLNMNFEQNLISGQEQEYFENSHDHEVREIPDVSTGPMIPSQVMGAPQSTFEPSPSVPLQETHETNNNLAEELQNAKNMRDSLQDRILDMEMSGNADPSRLQRLKMSFNNYAAEVKRLEALLQNPNQQSPSTPNSDDFFDSFNNAFQEQPTEEEFDIGSLTRSSFGNDNLFGEENSNIVVEDDITSF